MTEHPADPFRALADPTRRQILELLRGRSRAVRELASRFPQMSRPAVSKHLRILREARLATETREGRQRIYRLEEEALETVAGWIGELGVEPKKAALREAQSSAGRVPAPAARREPRRRVEPAERPAPSGRRGDPEPEPAGGGDWRAW